MKVSSIFLLFCQKKQKAKAQQKKKYFLVNLEDK